MYQAALSNVNVSVQQNVVISGREYQVKKNTLLIFTYYARSGIVSFRIGDRVIKEPKKTKELLNYSGYKDFKTLFKDHGHRMEFNVGTANLVLFLLEFTDYRITFD